MSLNSGLLALLTAAGAGMFMAVQGTMNARAGKIIGLWEATWLVHLIGLLAVSAVLLPLRNGAGNLSRYAEVPWYLYLAGPLGVIIVYAVASSIPQVGAAAATTAIITAQVLAAALIDHFGLLGLRTIPFHPIKVVGVLLLAAGAYVLLKNS